MAAITSMEALRARYGAPSPRAIAKQLDRLDGHCRAFIALSPFLVLATEGPDGLGDATPRGDHPGFVAVRDDRTLIIPDRPGNNRLDSLLNIVARPGVGILFLVPGVDETLRVNGEAVIEDEADLCAAHAVDGRVPTTVLVVTVREAYLQCGKALIRSKLWSPEGRIQRSMLPSAGEILKDHTRSDTPAESQERMVERYRQTLY